MAKKKTEEVIREVFVEVPAPISKVESFLCTTGFVALVILAGYLVYSTIAFVTTANATAAKVESLEAIQHSIVLYLRQESTGPSRSSDTAR